MRLQTDVGLVPGVCRHKVHLHVLVVRLHCVPDQAVTAISSHNEIKLLCVAVPFGIGVCEGAGGDVHLGDGGIVHEGDPVTTSPDQYALVLCA